MKFKTNNKQLLQYCVTIAVGLGLSGSLSASEVTIKFTGINGELAGPITGKVKFTGSGTSDVCTFSGSATEDVQVTKGIVAMASDAPIASGKAMRLNGGDMVATAGFSLPSIIMDQDGSLDTQNHSVDLNALSGPGELTIIGDGINEVNVTSDLSAHTVGGINVDNGNFYVNAGKTPNGPLKIASGAQLQLAGDRTAAVGQVTGALTVDAGGTVVVDDGKKVGDSVTQMLTYSFNTVSGYFESGTSKLPWPTNFLSHTVVGTDPNYLTSDTTDQYITYGDVLLNFGFSDTYGWVYWQNLPPFSSAHPTALATSDNDVALTGPVSMQAGSNIQLGAGATWACDVTVRA